MQKKAKLLIIEDESAIRTGLVDVFVFHGFDVDYAEDGPSGLEKALSGQFDLILLDVMLPELDGFQVCEKIRAQDRSQPIIMLTARNTDEDIIQGLSLGADDYVAKPFSITQLVLRVQAVLRRSGFDDQPQHQIVLSNQNHIDIQNLSGRVNGNPVHFTRREIEILQYLHQHNERPVPREELL